jgi:hypothetical protein
MAEHPDIFAALATEVVVTMGELLYIPSYWFHYIVSQDASIQCNARTREAEQGRRDIENCGYVKRFHNKEEDKEIKEGGGEQQEDTMNAVQSESLQTTTTTTATSNNRLRKRKHKKNRQQQRQYQQQEGIQWNFEA